MPFFGKDDTSDNNSSSSSSSNNSRSQSLDHWDEFAQGIANVLMHLRGTWYRSSSPLQWKNPENDNFNDEYKWERQRLEKYVKPFHYGMGATLFLFFNFRLTGNPRFQAWRNQMLAKWKQHQLPPPPSPIPAKQPTAANRQSQQHRRLPPPPLPTQPPNMGYLEAKREREVREALNSMRFITDVLVSVSVGVSGTLWLLHAQQSTMRQDWEEAPLVAGKSVVAEQMCTPFLKLKQQQQQERAVDDNEPNHTSFTRFIQHCQERRDQEQQIRSQYGLSEDIPVTIPYPGVTTRGRR